MVYSFEKDEKCVECGGLAGRGYHYNEIEDTFTCDACFQKEDALFRAASDLLSACKGVLKTLPRNGMHTGAISLLEGAIAKAENK